MYERVRYVTLAVYGLNGRDRSVKKTRVCRMRPEKTAWINFDTLGPGSRENRETLSVLGKHPAEGPILL